MLTMRHTLTAAILATFSGAIFANNLQDIPDAEAMVAASPDNWKVALGGAVFSIPEYEGAEDSESIGIPYVNLSYKDNLSFNIFNGLDFKVINTESFSAGIGLGIDFGRKEDKADILEGLGDIDTSIEPKVFVSYRLGKLTSKLTYAADASGDGHDGATLDLDLSYLMMLSKSTFFVPGLNVSYGNDDYMQSYFGITADQATNSKANLRRFEAEAGVKSAAVNLVFVKMLSEKWTIIGVAQYKGIFDDVKYSPLIQDDSQTLIGGIASYTF